MHYLTIIYMFASINYRITHLLFIIHMIVKLTKGIGITLKWVYKKLKGLFRISTEGVEIEVTENEEHDKNSIDLTIE